MEEENDEELEDLKVFWGEFNEYLIEDWMQQRKDLYSDERTNQQRNARPWERVGCSVSDYFNFGFTDETYHSFLLDLIRYKQEKILRAEQELQRSRQAVIEQNGESERFNRRPRKYHRKYSDHRHRRRSRSRS